MISVRFTGMCENCQEAELYIDKLLGDNVCVQQICNCDHRRACSRAYDLGIKEGLKMSKEGEKK